MNKETSMDRMFCPDNLRETELDVQVEYKQWNKDGSKFKWMKTRVDIKLEAGFDEDMVLAKIAEELGVEKEEIIDYEYFEI